MNLNKMNWSSQWAGNWSILSFSYWGDIYTKIPFSPFISKYVDHAICIWEKGESVGYQPTSEREQFARNLVANVQKDETFVETLCDSLVRKTNTVLDIIARHINADISSEAYISFQNALADYYPYHISVKYVADFLPEDLLKVYFDSLQEARVHAEPVFDRTEEFMRAFARVHERKANIPAPLLLCMVKDEFHAYLNGAPLPPLSVLQERNQATAIVSAQNEMRVLVGKDVESILSIVHQQASIGQATEVKGKSAYSGIMRGRVRVVTDPANVRDFQERDILVAGMTRPDYLPLMQKAAAFVTDSGGVLCHAAIVAREMKKPCVIGTKIATKVFKDGDIIEVDADKGVVKKI